MSISTSKEYRKLLSEMQHAGFEFEDRKYYYIPVIKGVRLTEVRFRIPTKRGGRHAVSESVINRLRSELMNLGYLPRPEEKLQERKDRLDRARHDPFAAQSGVAPIDYTEEGDIDYHPSPRSPKDVGLLRIRGKHPLRCYAPLPSGRPKEAPVIAKQILDDGREVTVDGINDRAAMLIKRMDEAKEVFELTESALARSFNETAIKLGKEPLGASNPDNKLNRVRKFVGKLDATGNWKNRNIETLDWIEAGLNDLESPGPGFVEVEVTHSAEDVEKILEKHGFQDANGATQVETPEEPRRSPAASWEGRDDTPVRDRVMAVLLGKLEAATEIDDIEKLSKMILDMEHVDR